MGVPEGLMLRRVPGGLRDVYRAVNGSHEVPMKFSDVSGGRMSITGDCKGS